MRGAARSLLGAFLRPVRPRPQLLAALARLPFDEPGMATPVGLHAAARPRGVAVTDDAGDMTWAELDERTNRAANAFLAEADASGRDRVAFGVRNGREAVECYTACARAGLTAVPLNTWAKPAELRHVLDEQDAGLVVADGELAERLPDGPRVLQVGGDGSYERALAAAAATRPASRGAPRVVTLTSGTTGRPKGAERTVSVSGLRPLVGLLDKVPLRASDNFLIAPPLFHAFAQGMLAVALLLGCRVVLTHRFDADQVAALVRRHDVTAAALVPVMLKRLVDVGQPAPHLRVVVVSGSALSASLRDHATDLWGPVVHDLYGSTEVGWAAIATPDDYRARPGTVGRPGRGMRVVAVSDGVALPAGEVGELHVSTGWQFEGYTGGQQPEGGVDGALSTGDLGWVDEDGYVYVTGRRDDMVVVGGENVYPAEVEAVLDAHELVDECTVVGIDDEEYGQVLHAYVVPRGEQLHEAELTAHLGEQLATYKVPRGFTFLDVLPRNAAGKVVRRDLPPPTQE